jgi:hypothetical protein
MLELNESEKIIFSESYLSVILFKKYSSVAETFLQAVLKVAILIFVTHK